VESVKKAVAQSCGLESRLTDKVEEGSLPVKHTLDPMQQSIPAVCGDVDDPVLISMQKIARLYAHTVNDNRHV
jgi:hypothetical protein